MASRIHVFDPAEVIAAIESGAQDVLQIREKPSKSKKDYKVKYFDMWIKTSEHEGPAIFAINEATVVFGPPDPALKEDDDGPRKLSVCTTVEESGDFGRMMELLNPLYVAEIDRCVNERKWFAKSKRNVKELIQTHYSEERTDEKRGQERDTPLISFNIDFSHYPSTHPRKFLRDQPKSLIYDFTDTYTVDGKTNYKLAKTPDGESLNDANAFMFVTTGSRICGGRIHLENLAISQSWISVPSLAGKLIIDTAGEGGFDDDVPQGDGSGSEEENSSSDEANEDGDDSNDSDFVEDA